MLTKLAKKHLPRRTVRLRLTLLYGAMFLFCGFALLTLTYILVSNAVPIGVHQIRVLPPGEPLPRASRRSTARRRGSPTRRSRRW